MSEFKKLKLKRFPSIQERESSEARYWKGFSTTFDDKLQGSPSSIHFNPLNSDLYAVSYSTKISLFDSLTDKLLRTYSRFKDDTYSARFRKDGRLIVAGDKSGYIKVFDVKTKSTLRQLKDHSAAVRSVVWTSDGLHMITGSDDKKINMWDLGTQEVTWRKPQAHHDYIRSVSSHPISSTIFASGSYDHSVSLWDSRQADSVLHMDQGHPVESSLIVPSGAMLLTAGGNEVKVWDLIAGGRLLHTFSNHQKNISCITLDGTGSKLLTAGLDGYLKICSLQSLQVSHSLRLGSPILSVAMSANNRKLSIGLVDGTLITKTRSAITHNVTATTTLTTSNKIAVTEDSLTVIGRTEEIDEERNSHVIAGMTDTDTGAGATPRQDRLYKGAGVTIIKHDEAIVESTPFARLRPYENFLRKFQYQQALDAALKTRNPVVVVTVLEELSRRSGLSIALSGRDEASLEPLLSFTARYISLPKYSRLIIQVAQKILDLYAHILGHSDAIDELFHKMHRQVKLELHFHRQIMRVMGSLDGIIHAASVSRSV